MNEHSPEEEDLCRRCGACCHEKFILEDCVVITDIPCEHYDPQAHACRIYAERRSRNPRCASARDAKIAGALPADCPYVRGEKDYRPAIFLRDHPELMPLLAEEIRALDKKESDT